MNKKFARERGPGINHLVVYILPQQPVTLLDTVRLRH